MEQLQRCSTPTARVTSIRCACWVILHTHGVISHTALDQAMMELGAVVCLGNGAEPKCEACPLASHCAAFQELRAYLEKGGHRADEAAPAVTRFPEKVLTYMYMCACTYMCTYMLWYRLHACMCA